jgi:hypothetical protein
MITGKKGVFGLREILAEKKTESGAKKRQKINPE